MKISFLFKDSYKRYPFFFFALYAILGILLASFNYVFAIPFGIFLLYQGYRKKNTSHYYLFFVIFCFFFSVHKYQLKFEKNFPISIKEGEVLPITFSGKVIDILWENHIQTVGIVKLKWVEYQNKRYPTTHRLLYTAKKNPIFFGDVIAGRSSLQLVSKNLNPKEMNPRKFWKRKGIHYQMLTLFPRDISIIQKKKGNLLKQFSIHASAWIKDQLKIGIEDKEEIYTTLYAMLLGDKKSASKEVKDEFLYSGTFHIFAVSGIHVAILAAIFWSILRVFGLKKRTICFLVIPLLCTYCILTGLRPSAIRATAMMSIILIGMLIDRRSSILNSLSFAAFFILLFNMRSLYDTGFQLSFSVLLSIAMFSMKFYVPIYKLFGFDPFLPRQMASGFQVFVESMWKKIAMLVAITCSAFIGSSPLMVAHFNLMTPISLVSNLFLALCIYFILFLSILSLISSGCTLLFLTNFFNIINAKLIAISLSLVSFFSDIPYGHFYTRLPDFFPSKEVTIQNFHLKNGGNAFVLHSNGKTSLIDLGSKHYQTRVVENYLKKMGINRVENVLLTKKLAKYQGNIEAFSNFFFPKQIFLSPLHLHKYTKKNKTNLNLLSVSAGKKVTLLKNIETTIYYPPKINPYTNVASKNGLSFMLNIHGWKLFFLNKMPKEALVNLSKNKNISCDILFSALWRYDIKNRVKLMKTLSPQAIVFATCVEESGKKIPKNFHTWTNKNGIFSIDHDKEGALEISIKKKKLLIKNFSNAHKIFSAQKP